MKNLSELTMTELFTLTNIMRNNYNLNFNTRTDKENMEYLDKLSKAVLALEEKSEKAIAQIDFTK